VLELFRNAAHRLTLKEAIERGELVSIRCIRVKTNVDLTRVRFNEIQYSRQDLETSITVPARNALIVQTYLEHVRGRKGVTVCVNVRHGETLAELYGQRGVAARSVSGSMPARERDEALAAFARGEVLMLCACDLLNEGWDCPDMQGGMPCHSWPPQWPKMQKPGNRAFPGSSDFWPGRPINQFR
jgi:superfamily II DNA or RNA helicase